MDIRILSTSATLAELGDAWRRLADTRAPDDPFQSWEWFDAAWQWCGGNAVPFVITCQRGSDLVGLLPLMLVRPGRTLKFIAVPDTQFCDALVQAGDEAEVAAAIADELGRNMRRWDVLRFANLRIGSFVVDWLAPALAARDFTCRSNRTTENRCVALEGDFAAYLGKRSRRLKKAINLAANRLTRAGAIDIDWLAPGTGSPADVDRALAVITGISGRSWKQTTGNALDQTGPQAFLRRLAHHAHRRGWLSVWTLALDGRPVAMELQLAAGGNVYALRSDFDAACDTLSPGAHLGRKLLERMFGQRWRTYWMGPGENPYKYRWSEHGEPVFALAVFARSARGRGLAAWETLIKPGARAVRDRLRGLRRARAATTNAGDAEP